MNLRTLFAAAAIAATVSMVAVCARSPSTTHHGMFGRMTGSHTMSSHRGMSSMMSGSIIGNKRSHVYHMPGDSGNMPDAANRVYFHSEAQARAAGYHRAGSPASSHTTMHDHSSMGHGMMGHGMMGHGMMGHGMMGHGMMGHGMMGHGMMGHSMMGHGMNQSAPHGGILHGMFHKH